MSYKVVTVPPFEKQLKRLVKKYPSLRSEYPALIDALEVDPRTGVGIGRSCFKIRLAIASKGKGRSGGARVITHFYVAAKTVFLLSIYDKSEKEDLLDKELDDLLAQIDA